MPRSRLRDAMASEPPWPARVFPLVSEKPESVHVFVLDGSSKVMMIHGMGMDSPLRKDSSDCCQFVLVCFLEPAATLVMRRLANGCWFFPGVCEIEGYDYVEVVY